MKHHLDKKPKQPFRLVIQNYISIGLIFVLIVALAIMIYILLEEDTYKFQLPKMKQDAKIYGTNELLEDIKNIKIKKNSSKKAPFQERGKIEDNRSNTVSLVKKEKKPKLVLIIDDVHTKKQLNKISKLGMKITPSIFPPYSLSEDTHILVQNLKHFIIHLPMESGSKQFNSQSKTLMTSFSDAQIVERVNELRMLFPQATYINSHTGSVFTSNYKIMKKLYNTLKMKGFVFIDSFTTASSKVEQISRELGDTYVRRDIFIDNNKSVIHIHKQLKRAVIKAKERGYAIAIGHPNKKTMQALRSADKILNDVELVYIDDIYKRK